jgi:hypothetical protein
MYRRDYRDILGGGILALLGTFVVLHSGANYRLGTFGQMGPGMFPFSLGVLIAAVGLIIMIPAFFRPGGLPVPEWRPLFFVLAAVASFALVTAYFGLAPAIAVLTVLSVLADNKLGPLGTFILAIVLCVIAIVIFRMGLGIQIPIYRWPF